MLNKNDILRSTDGGLKVFRYYLRIDFRVGKNFLNPLYKDANASCNVFYDRHKQHYRMKDFGNDAYSGDCFALVGKIYDRNCTNPSDFVEILQRINRDLNLGLDSNDSVIKIEPVNNQSDMQETVVQPLKAVKPFNTVQKHFTKNELDFWLQSGITHQILKQYRVISLKEFVSENKDEKRFSIHANENEPIFAYQGRKRIKLYRPFSSIRFMYAGEPEECYCFGLEQLPAKGDILFITGGERDVMSLAAHGFHAICFNSESSNIPKSIMV